MTRYDNEVPGDDGFEKTSVVDRAKNAAASTPTEFNPKKCFKDSIRQAREYQTQKLLTPWSRNYRAFQNRHFNGSKYDTLRYKNRSKIFKPKTRTAVRKNDASAAGAMFSTEDVVSITAERASDKLQASTAMFLHQALNYRLDRSNRWAGPNWFMTAIGARQDAQMQGVCVSKQYWEYEEKTVKEYVKVTAQRMRVDEMGMPMVDLITGDPVMEDYEAEDVQDSVTVTRDRLMITNVPGEQAFIDNSADWRDPIQEGGFFIAGWPSRRDDVQFIIEQQAMRNVMGGGAWRADIDWAELSQAKNDREHQSSAVRRARENGVDPLEGTRVDKNGDNIWLYECFYRYNGEDWHWWMLGENTVLSDPRPTIESYPEQSGDRPYVRGVGALETHRVYPMSPVESWQQAQVEINDITNLSLDALKLGISPITKIKRGQNVDMKQVQNRGPDASIMVNAEDDVTFDRAPGPPAESMMYNNILSNDFDDLAGVFSGSSVQNNRQLNETVGGMQLLNQNASALTEFDLRVWVETWAEPVLAQSVNCIRYYESDEVVIGVAGEKAGLIENLEPTENEKGLDPQQAEEENPDEMKEPSTKKPKTPPVSIHDVLGNLDKAQVTVKINVGIGALDSTQKLNKFMGAVKGMVELAPLLEQSGTKPNGDAIMQELFGLSGYKDADRFFIKEETGDEAPPPEIQKMMMQMQAMMERQQLIEDGKVALKQMDIGAKDQDRQLATAEFQWQQKMDRMELIMGRLEKALTPQPALSSPKQANGAQSPF